MGKLHNLVVYMQRSTIRIQHFEKPYRAPGEILLVGCSNAPGLVTDVVILARSNTDEGTADFFGPRNNLNTDADVQDLVASIGVGLSNITVAKIMELYPDNPIQGYLFDTRSERFASQGCMYKRGAAIIEDETIHAGRRFLPT